MSVLIDTSAWIRFLQGREPYLAEVDRLLEQGAVLGHEFVYGELLIGDPGGRLALLARYRLLPWTAPCTHQEAVALTHRHRLHGRGIGWIDVQLLASALRDGVEFLTADLRLNAIATELGIAPSQRDPGQ